MIRPGKNYEAIVLDIFLFPILAIFPPFEAVHSPLYIPLFAIDGVPSSGDLHLHRFLLRNKIFGYFSIIVP